MATRSCSPTHALTHPPASPFRVELALAEASRRRAVEGVQRAAGDVNRGIEAFEINMKRLLKGAGKRQIIKGQGAGVSHVLVLLCMWCKDNALEA